MYSMWALKKAARTIVKDMCNVRAGELVMLYLETQAPREVAESVAEAAHLKGAVVSVFRYEAHPAVNVEPNAAMVAAMKAADVNIYFAESYFIHTKAFEGALKAGARSLDIGPLGPEQIVRDIGEINYPRMVDLGDEIMALLRQGDKLEITTPAGTNLKARIDDRPVMHNTGRISKPGEYSYAPGGQVSWMPIEETINGTLVFDGSVWPPGEVGVLETPIKMNVKEGTISDISGGGQAKTWEKWLSSFNDPKMFRIAHYSYGFNPGCQLSGDIIEDERVYGVIELGIGAQFAKFKGTVGLAAGHTDGVMLNPTVKLDGQTIEEDGSFVHPKLAKIASEL